MHRKGLSMFLAAAMAIAIAAPGFAAGNPFPDVPADHWAYDAVTGLAAAGLVEGYPDGTFGGERTFTRYEMAMVFSRILTRMEALLMTEIDQRITNQSSTMAEQIANAAAKAQEALTAALTADSHANEAYNKAQEALAEVLIANSRANDAYGKAQEALKAALTADSRSNEAYSKAQEALTAALTAESRANEAYNRAQEALNAAIKADGRGNEAYSKAQEALTAAITADGRANEAFSRAQEALTRLNAIEAEIKALTDDVRALSASVDDATRQRAEEAWQLADAAIRKAQEASDFANQALNAIKSLPTVDLSAYEAAVNAAAAAAEEAKRLAAAAAKPEEVAEAKAAAQAAAEAAAKAAEMANAAAKLSDVAAAMDRANAAYDLATQANAALATALDRANAAYDLATQANAKADEALAAILAAKNDFIMNDAAKAAIAQYVTELLQKELATIEENAARIAALEKKAISADEARDIATRVVAEKLAGALGRISDLETAVAAVNGDIASIHKLIQDKVDAITASIEALGTEFAKETAELRAQVAGLQNAIDAISARQDAFEANQKQALQNLGAQMADADAKLLAKINDHSGLILDNAAGIVDANMKIGHINREIEDLQTKLENIDNQLAKLAQDDETAKARLDQLAGDLADLQTRTEDIEEQLAGVWEAAAFILNDSEAKEQQINDLKRKTDEAAQKAEDMAAQIATLQAKVKENEVAIAANQAAISENASGLTALAEKHETDTKQLAGILAPIKEKFDATEINMGAHLVVTTVSGNTVIKDPRSPNQSVRQKATAADWYNESSFLKNEAQAIYSLNLATQPAIGANLRSTLYISKDLLQPGIHDAGLNIDLTTNSTLHSLHLGSLQTGTPGFDLSNFNPRVLCFEKWDALLWQPSGLQANLVASKWQADLIMGQGSARRIGADLNPAAVVPNSDASHYGAVSLTVPFNNLFTVRANWLNLTGTSLGALPTPAKAAAKVQSLSLFGSNDVMNYNANIAAKSDSQAKSGDIQISQVFGQTGTNDKGQPLGVKVLAEYGCSEDGWLQPMAIPQLAATLEGKQEKYLGLEISGIHLLDFYTKLTHRSVNNFSGNRSSLLINAKRELKVMLPLVATVEYGLNDDVNSTQDYQHFMIELGINKYKLFGDRLAISASYAKELNPIQAKDWEQRWRNINVVDAFWSPGQLQQGKNWAVDNLDLETMRQASQVNADWVLGRSADGRTGVVLQAGYRQINDVLNSSKATVVDEQVISIGLQANMNVYGTDLTTIYGWEGAKGALSPKESLSIGFNKAIGAAGLVEGEAKGSWGQGAEQANVNTVQAYLKWEQPVYEAAQWQLKAGYSRLQGSVADDFTAFTLNSGLIMRF